MCIRDRVLTEPLKEFSNVHLHRTFIPNEKVHELHKENGILLIPSRHDAHAVAMSEAASSGVVVVGSDVTSNGDVYKRQSKSFFSLMKMIPLEDAIYVFSDQDDVWLPYKLQHIYHVFETDHNSKPLLYCGDTILTDQELHILKKENFGENIRCV